MNSLPFEALARHSCDIYSLEDETDLRALVAGGSELLRSGSLARILARHDGEAVESWRRRLDGATYSNSVGAAVAAQTGLCFMGSPLVCSSTPDAAPYMRAFERDATGAGCSLTALLRSTLWEALVVRRAAIVLEMPDVAGPWSNLLEQEASGALDVRARLLGPRELVDLETVDGVLSRVVLHRRERLPRRGIKHARSTDVKHVFDVLTREGWARFEVIGPRTMPRDRRVPCVASGRHLCNAVPIVLVDLGTSLADTLASTAAAIMRRESGLDAAMAAAANPILSAHLEPAHADDPITSDPWRALRTAYGAGSIVVLGGGDSIRYTSPDPAIWEGTMERVEASRQASRRVAHQAGTDVAMRPHATGDGPGGAADSDAARAIAGEHGRALRDVAKRLLELAVAGRGDERVEWDVRGLDKHEFASRERVIENEARFQRLAAFEQSPTAALLHAAETARVLLEQDATPETMAAVREELDRAFGVERDD